jgi:hypothetical protein
MAKQRYANHPFHKVHPAGDYRGIPTPECVCGGRMFYVLMHLSDDYTIAGYDTTALCADCLALVTIATEIDHPEYEEE